ncbi:hypothetical protein ATE80_09300 [Streptomyces kanasensis]|uniref:Peptidase S33 tripeptidyl aminopeptidase-like C-terminal domain-containing protein n=1 Tax=Streptomyces kanasensis TaxID=936756 RepID=A0A117IX09_9ACTN|nr:hypothetical protein ATE80_09300 [Streptomyces kanasensis]
MLACAGLAAGTVPALGTGNGDAWRPCPAKRTAQCATVRVPVDWSRPDGPSIRLDVARKPAKRPAQRLGTLVVNYGGPGEHDVGELLDEDDGPLERLRDHFDLVALNTRNVHVKCGARLVAMADQMPVVLVDQRAHRTRVAYNRALAASCRTHSGGLFGHVDSRAMARDVDAVRAFLGEPRISFLGISYGTVIGGAYAQYHPTRLRALVLDSTLDHSLDAAAFTRDTAAAMEETFQAAAQWCATSTSCAQHGHSPRAISAGIRRLFTAAEENRLADAEGRPVSVDALLWGNLSLQQSSESSWPAMFEEWDDYTVLHTPPRTRPAWPALPGDPGPATEEAETALLCADWHTGNDTHRQAARMWAISKKAAPSVFGNRMHLERAARCAGWPAPVTYPQQPLRAAGAPPALVVNARYDVSTPLTQARSTTTQLPGARLLTYEGAGHSVHLRLGSPCVRTAVERYLTTLRLPRSGATCPSTDHPPR